MTTIKEDYCSQEVYILLIKKGFDGEIHTTFDKEGYTQASITLQMAMKWLREVCNRFIEVQTDKGHDFKSIVFRPAIYDEDLNCLWESDNYKSYEQAAEAAIKHCLEHLNNHDNN